MLGTDNAAAAKKRFLSRTARYSGLLNILDFATVDYDVKEQLDALLVGMVRVGLRKDYKRILISLYLSHSFPLFLSLIHSPSLSRW
jgi:hypothetical protein